ncbi:MULTISPECIES: sigma factor-binding protein Crl [unclassified Vibrio]|uniref:Sigma factor-binding protein Crl n=1 Tax=Vibrio sp. HB236076 TaxID=3232307 RepID=A0AB39HET1_9VIBR|nr:sigma factor-binding protein Crl [Vibrio sp. HB161653]MDP5254171.1 sigma factor-binding protein Crl [Vibrio sp. HB161653]
MSEAALKPTYHRLIAKFKSIGPYLREEQSSQQGFFFDCFSLCVDSRREPDSREFYGWWMLLTPNDNGDEFYADYQIGLFDQGGNWQQHPLSEKALSEVKQTLDDFDSKLQDLLSSKFGLSVKRRQ